MLKGKSGVADQSKLQLWNSCSPANYRTTCHKQTAAIISKFLRNRPLGVVNSWSMTFKICVERQSDLST